MKPLQCSASLDVPAVSMHMKAVHSITLHAPCCIACMKTLSHIALVYMHHVSHIAAAHNISLHVVSLCMKPLQHSVSLHAPSHVTAYEATPVPSVSLHAPCRGMAYEATAVHRARLHAPGHVIVCV